ncbi:MAG: class I SAM-dependent DNA methyltransferase [Candidatus Marithrix sp.]
MALSWNEIKDRALKFSKEWQGETREYAEAKSFWDGFFHIFGMSRRRLASFEQPVKKLNNKYGFIDLFWKGTLLVEHKSRGKNLDRAYLQALDYFSGLKERELPKYVLVSDFENFRLYDLDDSEEYEFNISELHINIKLFGFIAGYQKRGFKEEDPVNIKAAELLGKLHDLLDDSGYNDHPLEVLLVRVLFCLFADSTGIFEQDLFKEFVEVKTGIDGSNLGALLSEFFQVLNTPHSKRLKNLDESLNQFPYINGKLFEEPLPIPAFNSQMREMLLDCCNLDWGKISPAIFGSMFQSVMKPEERRNLGAHYTSEKNIMKLIKPLFLDELWEEFGKVKKNKTKLKAFHKRLAQLNFLDPACGCGNFLIISYRELRLLELEVLRELKGSQQAFNIDLLVLVEVDQFYGIEYDEWPVRISEVAMWLMDHQMNLLVSEEFGQYFTRLPLRKSANIVHGNALRINWENIVPKKKLNYILGNPPFYGSRNQNSEQKQEIKLIFAGVRSYGVLDYIAAWYFLATKYIQNTRIKIAFVSTNSIVQGDQVGVLWDVLLKNYGIKIHFAHSTFKWNNEAKSNAAVHVVIIGFANFDIGNKLLFEYDDINGESHEKKVKNINPYLVDAEDIIIFGRTKPMLNILPMMKGNAAIDNGNLILTPDEKDKLISNFPEIKHLVKPYIGSKELINGLDRFCLWLKNATPKEIKSNPEILRRVNNIKEWRSKSKKEATRKWANFPTLFMEDRQPDNDYLMIPVVSSENRNFIPTAFLNKNVIANYSAFIIPNATLFEFGIINSTMHMAWTKYTCGRLESRYRYSNKIVYNNFPWPKDLTKKNKVEKAAQKILDVRAEFPDSSLADLYDPLTMPPKLVKAHQSLDKAVDLCYRSKSFSNEMARIEYLFELYNEYI